MAAHDLGSKLSLKLLIDTKGRRVLFAEADKKAVDFLFHILTLPMATVIKLVTKQQMVGCLANLYDSVENLSETYIQSSQTKDMVLKPRTLTDDDANILNPLFALPSNINMKQNNVSYTCSSRWMNGHCGSEAIVSVTDSDSDSDSDCDCVHSHKIYKRRDQKLYFSDRTGAKCPKCKLVMSMEMSYVLPQDTVANIPKKRPRTGKEPVDKLEQKVVKKQRTGTEQREAEEAKGGFVKGVVTYMVMDDLVVKPVSNISSIALLNTLNVRDVGSLEERVVDVGIKEALKLLKTSLASKEVLTTVFLKTENSK